MSAVNTELFYNNFARIAGLRKEISALMLSAQRQACAMIVEGKSTTEIDEATASKLSSAAKKEQEIYSLSH